MISFKLWLEFEEVDPNSWDKENDFTNCEIELPDGRHYGLNIWTFKFLETAIQLNIREKFSGNDNYIIPPNLFVKELARECIEKAIIDLVQKGNLEKMLNPSILIKS